MCQVPARLHSWVFLGKGSLRLCRNCAGPCVRWETETPEKDCAPYTDCFPDRGA